MARARARQVAAAIRSEFTKDAKHNEAMNGLLREAFAEYPGRHHYALLKWPRDRKGKEPDKSEIAAESAKYLEFGVRPVWFDDFAELPGLIRQLQ